MTGKSFWSALLLTTLSSGSSFAAVTTQQALRDGCYTDSQIAAFVAQGEASPNIGSITLESAKSNLRSAMGGSVTKMKVNAADTWVFRGYGKEETDNWHTKKLLQGVIYSNGQNRRDIAVKKDPGGEPEYWERMGPNLKSDHISPANQISLMMRLLSIKTSYGPPSQFVSFAVSYKIASGFGDVVYAFQVNPDSPVLGVVDCKLNGEDQFQILGGTLISSPIYRKSRKDSHWKKYDRNSGRWNIVTSGETPPMS